MQLRRAVRSIRMHPQFKLLGASSIYRSVPMGPATQPHYLNAVIAVRCSQRPLKVLQLTQSIERSQGRRKRQHWGPRSLDIDLLLYGRHELSHPRLKIPHPRMQDRAFVLIPLLELAPELRLPNGRALNQYDALQFGRLAASLQRLSAPLAPRSPRF